LGWLRRTAEKKGLPCQSLVIEILAGEMRKANQSILRPGLKFPKSRSSSIFREANGNAVDVVEIPAKRRP